MSKPKKTPSLHHLHQDDSESRRYLVSIDSHSTHQLFTDCLVIGSGIAGLRAALEAAKHCHVMLVCKKKLRDSNTWKAQGGIASVLQKTDSFDSHMADTLKAGCGLGDPEVVSTVVRQGPQLLEELITWGTDFDRVDGDLDVTLEGGHSKARVAHAHGDETGRIIAQALINQVKTHPNISIMEDFYAIDLLTDKNGPCLGLIGADRKRGLQIIWATHTILASGGVGQLFRETTNPDVATGDGMAMADRAGAILRDLEFMQFHPTTLYIAGASRALITETLRGEGAHLIDCDGTRFMHAYHESAELAPRDVVSRAILAQMRQTESTHVFLDIRHFDKNHFQKRFPLISELCESFDIDTSRDLIPVRPSAHYMVGGVKVDPQGRTNIPNLLACGEVASTCLHGANRLGTNSLLEGLVFGMAAGKTACQATHTDLSSVRPPLLRYAIPSSDRSRLDTADVRNSLRALMWRNVGITRKHKPLEEAQEIIRFWQRYVMDKVFECPPGWECQNMLTLGMLMARSAQQRLESRGVHYRLDHTDMDDAHFQHHIEVSKAKLA